VTGEVAEAAGEAAEEAAEAEAAGEEEEELAEVIGEAIGEVAEEEAAGEVEEEAAAAEGPAPATLTGPPHPMAHLLAPVITRARAPCLTVCSTNGCRGDAVVDQSRRNYLC
jgi:hypothetical protein